MLIQWMIFMWCHIKPILQIILLVTAVLVFLFAWPGIGGKMSLDFFISFIPQYQITNEWQEYYSTHTQWNFESYSKVNQKLQPVLFFFFISHHTKKKARRGRMCAYRCVPCRATPLYLTLWVLQWLVSSTLSLSSPCPGCCVGSVSSHDCSASLRTQALCWQDVYPFPETTKFKNMLTNILFLNKSITILNRSCYSKFHILSDN